MAAAATLIFAARSIGAQVATPEVRQVLPRMAVPRDAESNAAQVPAAAGFDNSAQRAGKAAAPNASMLPADHPMARSAFRAASSSPFAGTTVQRLGLDRSAFSLAQRGAHGNYETQCVAGADAAHAALHGHRHQVGKEVRHAR
jgi:hypothetical protein